MHCLRGTTEFCLSGEFHTEKAGFAAYVSHTTYLVQYPKGGGGEALKD